MTAGKTATIREDMQVDKAGDLKSPTFGLGAQVVTQVFGGSNPPLPTNILPSSRNGTDNGL